MLRISLLMCAAVAASATSIADTLLNFQNIESLVLSGKGKELPAVVKVVVESPNGLLRVDQVEGASGGTWLRARGVQYAEHPVDSRRWQPPVRLAPWTSVRDATQWGDDCVQGPFLSQIESIQTHSMSESCLYLNVWAPSDAAGNVSSTPLPVMLWIHGGSFTLGGTTSYSGDGMFSYKRDVVLVTVNYRLGALGFLGGAAVAANTTDGSSGNFGLQDTRMAMEWVARNIAAFGGDPKRITIFGESAGASMVESHLAAPRSNGLFAAAIMQSGAFDNYTIQPDPQGNFHSFAAEVGCDTEADVMACLRATPLWYPDGHGGLFPALANSSGYAGFGPTKDDVEFVESPEQSAMAGRLNNVSAAMLGTCLNEGRMLMPIMMPIANAPLSSHADLVQWLHDYYPCVEGKVGQMYQKDLAALGPWGTAALIYTDSQYLCPTQRSAQWLADMGAATYVYRVEHKPSTYRGDLLYQTAWCEDYSRCPNATALDVGVGHGADVSLLFNDPRLNADDQQVAYAMIDYWQNFAASFNPNAGVGSHASDPALPQWPDFGQANTIMTLTRIPIAASQLRAGYCNFWAHTDSGLPPILTQH